VIIKENKIKIKIKMEKEKKWSNCFFFSVLVLQIHEKNKDVHISP
jgi:hypothetical protein